MTEIKRILLATETWNVNDGSSAQPSWSDGADVSYITLTINIEGNDVVDGLIHFKHGGIYMKAIAGIGETGAIAQFETNLMTNSSVRVGLRSDDAWAPRNVLLMGEHPGTFAPIPLAIETDLDTWLSADHRDANGNAHLTIPVRLVRSKDNPDKPPTLIRRVLILIGTDLPFVGGKMDYGTNDPIELEIKVGGQTVLQEQIRDTFQEDLEAGSANWYFLPQNDDGPFIPFVRDDLLSNGEITLRILGEDRWLPQRLFVFGLDTTRLQGRPNVVMTLVSIPSWSTGYMSTDPDEDPLKGIRKLPLSFS